MLLGAGKGDDIVHEVAGQTMFAVLRMHNDAFDVADGVGGYSIVDVGCSEFVGGSMSSALAAATPFISARKMSVRSWVEGSTEPKYCSMAR